MMRATISAAMVIRALRCVVFITIRDYEFRPHRTCSAYRNLLISVVGKIYGRRWRRGFSDRAVYSLRYRHRINR